MADLVPGLVPTVDDLHQRIFSLVSLQGPQHFNVVWEQAESAGDDVVNVRFLQGFWLAVFDCPCSHDDRFPFERIRRCRVIPSPAQPGDPARLLFVFDHRGPANHPPTHHSTHHSVTATARGENFPDVLGVDLDQRLGPGLVVVRLLRLLLDKVLNVILIGLLHPLRVAALAPRNARDLVILGRPPAVPVVVEAGVVVGYFCFDLRTLGLGQEDLLR